MSPKENLEIRYSIIRNSARTLLINAKNRILCIRQRENREFLFLSQLKCYDLFSQR